MSSVRFFGIQLKQFKRAVDSRYKALLFPMTSRQMLRTSKPKPSPIDEEADQIQTQVMKYKRKAAAITC